MWEQVHSNQRRSFFVVAFMGVMLIATGIAFGAILGGGAPEAAALGGAAAVVVWVILWIIAATSGDKVMLKLAGAREIKKKDHPQLVNVVEEMTIAAALPKTPRIFIVDDPAPNAFATGRSPDNAAVTVTTGLLGMMNRDELQGVIGHEIGHVKNRDIKLMTTAGIMVGTVVILAEVGRRVLFYGGGRRSRSSSGGGQAQLVILVVSLLFMLLAPIMAQLLYLALSRRREYLADASGAMYTRYPEGLASALEKMAGNRRSMARTSAVTAPMYICPPRAAKGKKRAAWSSTHPPTEERVRILRSMAAGAGFDAYDAAFKQVKGEGVIGRQSLLSATPVEARAGTASAMDPSDVARTRLARDAVLHSSGYVWMRCDCGATTKVPPSLQGKLRACPRCGEPYG